MSDNTAQPMKTQPEVRASIFTQEQEADLRRLKSILPYRIVWGAVKAETGEFITGADYDRRKLMRYLRKGWLVASIG